MILFNRKVPAGSNHSPPSSGGNTLLKSVFLSVRKNSQLKHACVSEKPELAFFVLTNNLGVCLRRYPPHCLPPRPAAASSPRLLVRAASRLLTWKHCPPVGFWSLCPTPWEPLIVVISESRAPVSFALFMRAVLHASHI